MPAHACCRLLLPPSAGLLLPPARSGRAFLGAGSGRGAPPPVPPASWGMRAPRERCTAAGPAVPALPLLLPSIRAAAAAGWRAWPGPSLAASSPVATRSVLLLLLLLPLCRLQAAPASQGPALGLLGTGLQALVFQETLLGALLSVMELLLRQGCAQHAVLLRQLLAHVAGKRSACRDGAAAWPRVWPAQLLAQPLR